MKSVIFQLTTQRLTIQGILCLNKYFNEENSFFHVVDKGFRKKDQALFQTSGLQTIDLIRTLRRRIKDELGTLVALSLLLIASLKFSARQSLNRLAH